MELLGHHSSAGSSSTCSISLARERRKEDAAHNGGWDELKEGENASHCMLALQSKGT